jgi:hypothetical protein
MDIICPELIMSWDCGVVIAPQKTRIDGVIELQIAPYHTNVWLLRSIFSQDHARVTPRWGRKYLFAGMSYGAKARLQHMHR